MQQILNQLEHGTVWNVGDNKQIHRPPTAKELLAARTIRSLMAKIELLERSLNTAIRQAHEYQNLYETGRKTSEMGMGGNSRHSEGSEYSSSPPPQDSQGRDSSGGTSESATTGASS